MFLIHTIKELYQRIGSFFIAIAPIMVGCLFIFIFCFLLVPNVYKELIYEIKYKMNIDIQSYSLTTIKNMVSIIQSSFLILFSPSNTKMLLWWFFIIISISVVSHMELSTVDMKNGFSGFIFFAVLILFFDLILFLININLLVGFTDIILSICVFSSVFFTISIIFSMVIITIALIIKLVFKIIF